MKGFKNTRGPDEITKYTMYEILEFKVQIKNMMVEQTLLADVSDIPGKAVLSTSSASAMQNHWQKMHNSNAMVASPIK